MSNIQSDIKTKYDKVIRELELMNDSKQFWETIAIMVMSNNQDNVKLLYDKVMRELELMHDFKQFLKTIAKMDIKLHTQYGSDDDDSDSDNDDYASKLLSINNNPYVPKNMIIRMDIW
jgi:hypothetical protein